ncbi:MAG: M20/M25/M40 family metallo-hydrolase [Bdellovibrionaceae bacterium]|nr:M20/M25/M40 family metallo-hydrolase [Bdellovibrio sp.]
MTYSKHLFSMVFALSLTASVALAKQNPNSSIEFINQCLAAPNCELNLFAEVSKTYRPSGEETELRDYVLAIKNQAEKMIWKKQLETFQDKIGNILIRLPATGKFVGKNANYFSLQSHMDMVLAYADAKPGEDIKPYFKDGVRIEVKDGWLQSVGNKTSLGADNGIGVAMELRYLIDPKIDHPPLELIFTVQEETGLLGAFGSELPILSKKMLCLDGMTPEPGFIIAGAQGASGNEIKGTVTDLVQADSDNTMTVQVTVTQLAGGHSGGDIHRNRLNAIKAFGSLIKFLSSKVGEVSVKTLVAGDVGVLNKIPNLFQAELVIPKSKVTQDLNYQIETYLKTLIMQNPDDGAKGKITVSIITNAQQKTLTNHAGFTQFLVDSIENASNGVLDTDPAYFNGVFTSSNLSFMKISQNQTGQTDFLMGFLTRSFRADRITYFANSITTLFASNRVFYSPLVTKKMEVPPWMEPDSSELLNETLTQTGLFTKKFYLAGGLEPSAFKGKIKDLQVIALGPFNQLAHSVNEKLKVDSVEPTAQGIRKILSNQRR